MSQIPKSINCGFHNHVLTFWQKSYWTLPVTSDSGTWPFWPTRGLKLKKFTRLQVPVSSRIWLALWAVQETCPVCTKCKTHPIFSPLAAAHCVPFIVHHLLFVSYCPTWMMKTCHYMSQNTLSSKVSLLIVRTFNCISCIFFGERNWLRCVEFQS